VQVRFFEARSIDVTADGEKRLKEFEGGLVRKMEELRGLYAGNIQIIGGPCSQKSTEEPSIEDYLRWLSEEISGLPEMFSGVNENFATAAIEGALAMARDSVDFDGVRCAAAESGAENLPTGHDVRRAVWAVSNKWWHSFGYDYVMAAIQAS
jgi:hypothetical protein